MERQMLQISWTDYNTNQRIQERVGKEKKLLTTKKARKLEYMGHIIRNNQQYKILQQGKIKRKRSVG